MKITKKIASRLELRGESLDKFMERVSIPYGTSLAKVNEALKERGIEPFTEEEVLEVSNPLQLCEEIALEKIARISRMDCWFGIDDNGRVYDREGDIKGKTDKTRRVLISQLIDGMTRDTWDALTDDERYNVVNGIAKCLDF